MSVWLWLVVAWLVLDALATVVVVGRRVTVKPSHAVGAVISHAAMIVAIVVGCR